MGKGLSFFAPFLARLESELASRIMPGVPANWKLIRLYTWRVSSGRIFGLILAFVVPLLLWWVGLLSAWTWSEAAAIALLGVFLNYAIAFLYYWWKRETLEWAPRRINPKMRRRMAEYLRPYGFMHRRPCPVVYIQVVENVSDADLFVKDICTALKDGGWGYDLESFQEQDRGTQPRHLAVRTRGFPP